LAPGFFVNAGGSQTVEIESPLSLGLLVFLGMAAAVPGVPGGIGVLKQPL